MIYPNISNNNINNTSISPPNVYSSPINPNFNPLLSQQNQPNFNNPRGNQLRNDPQMFVFNQKTQAASPKNNNAIPPANLFKTFCEPKLEPQAIKEPKMAGNTNINNNNNPVSKKENEKTNNLTGKTNEKQIEKKDSKESEPKLEKKDPKETEQKTTDETKSFKFFYLKLFILLFFFEN